MRRFILIVTAIAIALVGYENPIQAQVQVNSGGIALPVIDTNVLVEGSLNPTKGIRFEVDGLTSGVTRVITAQDANGTMVLDTGTGFTPPTGMLTIGRLLVTGFTPTCSSTGATSAAISSNSTDLAGSCIIVGNGANATGIVTLTFSTSAGAYGSSAAPCILSLGNGSNGTSAAWDIHSLVVQTSYSTTAPTFTWYNNSLIAAVPLVLNQSYNVTYLCPGRL